MSVAARKFLRVYALLFTLSMATTGMINLCVDPFCLFHMVEVPVINGNRPAFFRSLRMAKAHAVRVLRPEGIILGTSRAETGLDPDHPGWDPQASPRYNLALSGCRIFEAYAYLRHAHAIRPLRQVVIGLDLMMFDDRVKTESGFDEDRLAYRDRGPWPGGWVHDLLTSLFTIDALGHTVETLRIQGEPPAHPYLKNGLGDDRDAWSRIQRIGGHRRVDQEIVAPEQTWEGFGATLESLDSFRDLVRFCRSEDIDLRLFVSPLHALAQGRILHAGRWPIFEGWKKGLVAVLAESRDADGRTFPLWDFSGYNTITTERFPPLGDAHHQMKWYWESSHYKTVVGNMVLDRLFGSETPTRPVPGDFGVALTSGNIETHLAAIRKRQTEYLGSPTALSSR